VQAESAGVAGSEAELGTADVVGWDHQQHLMRRLDRALLAETDSD